MWRPWVLLFLTSVYPLLAQTTQGIITGRITSLNGSGLEAARIEFTRYDRDSGAVAQVGTPVTASSTGYYLLADLTPGMYSLRVSCPEYQTQEIAELELFVASRLQADFTLRPLREVWNSGYQAEMPGAGKGAGAIVQYYSADVAGLRAWKIRFVPAETLSRAATMSYVMDAGALGNLPLNGRDLYSGLALQPNVTSDTSTGRGLGLAINGLRPTSSNFLLDGIENNNYLTTGPLAVVAPEAALEYRVSVNNFSAEYGRAAGYIANAVTRSGANQWHGIGYFNLKNDVLNANTFQYRQLPAVGRRPYKELQAGGSVSGKLIGDRVFFSAAGEQLRSRTRLAPKNFVVPPSGWIANTSRTSTARKLLTDFAPPAADKGDGFVAAVTMEQPVSIDRTLALGRLDFTTRSGRVHAFSRVSVSRPSQPDFVWSPYAGFNSELTQPVTSTVFSLSTIFKSRWVNETRLGWTKDNLRWDRAHPEIPTLVESTENLQLPGSPSSYGYSSRGRSFEWNDSLTVVTGLHSIKLGGGILARALRTNLTFGRDGFFAFDTALDFYVENLPTTFNTVVDRTALPRFVLPAYDRRYRYFQYHAFFEDTFRVTRNLTLNAGLRYENFGVPSVVGPEKDAIVRLGEGATFQNRLAGASVKPYDSNGIQRLFGQDNNNFAPRVGLTFAPEWAPSFVIRAAYGIFFDRPFDNYWLTHRNNNFAFVSLDYNGAENAYLDVRSALTAAAGELVAADFPPPVLFDPNLRTGYAQQYFAQVERRWGSNFTTSLGGAGTLGRKLITSDIVNRAGTQDIVYRAGQGSSTYHALSAVARWGSPQSGFQASYTWSHSIDNQSDALRGDFFDLSYTGLAARPQAGRGRAAFALEGDSRADRGNSDFDQRHNLVYWAYWNVPRQRAGRRAAFLYQDWNISSVGALRSGFPFSILATSTGTIINQRADVVSPERMYVDTPLPGGRRLLERTAFSGAAGRLGTSARNGFAGPGFYSFDLSAGRSFPLRFLGESGRISFRADAYNVLNHSNLGQPDPLITTGNFGKALYGRKGTASNFPGVAPLDEAPRQIQLILRVQF